MARVLRHPVVVMQEQAAAFTRGPRPQRNERERMESRGDVRNSALP